jgi:hypothetical protein
MKIQNSLTFIETYIHLKKSFKVRSSANIVEIVTSTGKKIYEHKNQRFKEGLYLFGMVKRDVLNYIAENGSIEPYMELPVNYANQNFDYDNNVIGLDIDNAYWSVAKLKGYISKKTYDKGLEQKDGMKSIRLSCLSTLGKSRVYNVYEDGIYVGDENVKEDKELQDIYNDVRFSTYGVMLEISELLGKDFCCWKTDCIFFKDTIENRDKAKMIIESYGLNCKIETTK